MNNRIKVIAIIPESNIETLKEELPELWENEEIEVKVVENWTFKHWSEIYSKIEHQPLTEEF